MKTTIWIAALALAGCDAGVRPQPKTTVSLTSVAFADDCGGTPPAQPPMRRAPAKNAAPASPAVAASEPMRPLTPP